MTSVASSVIKKSNYDQYIYVYREETMVFWLSFL